MCSNEVINIRKHSQQKQNDLILSLIQHRQDKIMVYLIRLRILTKTKWCLLLFCLSHCIGLFYFPGSFRPPYSSTFCSGFWDKKKKKNQFYRFFLLKDDQENLAAVSESIVTLSFHSFIIFADFIQISIQRNHLTILEQLLTADQSFICFMLHLQNFLTSSKRFLLFKIDVISVNIDIFFPDLKETKTNSDPLNPKTCLQSFSTKITQFIS